MESKDHAEKIMDPCMDRAFPNHHVADNPMHEAGISKLGYYAAAALSGFLANSNGNTVIDPEYYAKAAVDHAEALIKELNKRLTPPEESNVG